MRICAGRFGFENFRIAQSDFTLAMRGDGIHADFDKTAPDVFQQGGVTATTYNVFVNATRFFPRQDSGFQRPVAHRHAERGRACAFRQGIQVRALLLRAAVIDKRLLHRCLGNRVVDVRMDTQIFNIKRLNDGHGKGARQANMGFREQNSLRLSGLRHACRSQQGGSGPQKRLETTVHGFLLLTTTFNLHKQNEAAIPFRMGKIGAKGNSRIMRKLFAI